MPRILLITKKYNESTYVWLELEQLSYLKYSLKYHKKYYNITNNIEMLQKMLRYCNENVKIYNKMEFNVKIYL